MEPNFDENVPKHLPRTHVRFSEQEFARIEKASRTTGRSIPWLLKTAFFNNGDLSPAFDKESARALQVELNRIGVNINQIAREINSGIRRGWNKEFEELNHRLGQILQMMAVRFANRNG